MDKRQLCKKMRNLSRNEDYIVMKEYLCAEIFGMISKPNIITFFNCLMNYILMVGMKRSLHIVEQMALQADRDDLEELKKQK